MRLIMCLPRLFCRALGLRRVALNRTYSPKLKAQEPYRTLELRALTWDLLRLCSLVGVRDPQAMQPLTRAPHLARELHLAQTLEALGP